MSINKNTNIDLENQLMEWLYYNNINEQNIYIYIQREREREDQMRGVNVNYQILYEKSRLKYKIM